LYGVHDDFFRYGAHYKYGVPSPTLIHKK
jgi:hypothetical protein